MQAWKFTHRFLGGFGLFSVIPPFSTYRLFFSFFIHLLILERLFVLVSEGVPG